MQTCMNSQRNRSGLEGIGSEEKAAELKGAQLQPGIMGYFLIIVRLALMAFNG